MAKLMIIKISEITLKSINKNKKVKELAKW